MAEPQTPPPGPPNFPGFQQYVILTLTLDGGTKRGRLTVTGPKAPGIGATPTIGVGRDDAGNYHFLVGSGEDHVYRPQDVPDEILKMLGGSSSSSGASSGPPTTEMWLPAADVLRRKSDGAFMTFEQYESNRVWNNNSSGLRTLGGKVSLWPKLTPEIFYMMIDLYRGRGQRARDYGDYPMPSGSRGVA